MEPRFKIGARVLVNSEHHGVAGEPAVVNVAMSSCETKDERYVVRNGAGRAMYVHADELEAVTEADFTLRNEGSIMLLDPRTDAAKAWVDRNLVGGDPGDEEELQYWGSAVVIQAHYYELIEQGIAHDGLTVEEVR